MALTTTRRTLLAGSTMLLAGRAAAQQATTLKLYAFGYDTDAAVIAANAAISFSYTKDDIMAVGGVFYALAAYGALRAAIARAGSAGL